MGREIKQTVKRMVVLLLAVLIGLAAIGAGYGAWSKDLGVQTEVNTGLIGVEFIAYTCSDVPGEPDLGYTKDVADCFCELVDSDNDGDYDLMEITVTDAYPSYQCLYSVTVGNNATVPVYIADTSLMANSDPAALALEGFWLETNMVGTELYPGESTTGSFWLHVTWEAEQSSTYTFTVRIRVQHDEFVPQDLGGTIGFWKNWDSHNTYTAEEIEGWLGLIDAASCWQGPTTIGCMEAVLIAATGGTQEQKFLGHYLATRLDGESGRLTLTAPVVHDVTGLDEDNYLGLADPSEASLSEIFDAIEGKCGESPTEDEFEVMKDICDALNNLEI